MAAVNILVLYDSQTGTVEKMAHWMKIAGKIG